MKSIGVSAAGLVLFATRLAAQDAPAVDAEALRAQRMTEDRARCEALVEAIDKFGHLDEFAGEMQRLLGTAKDRWVPVREGYLTDVGCQNWLAWNVKRDGVYTFPAPTPDEGHPFDVIVDVNRQLREQGIDFLLLTFPTRGQLYPELFMDLPSMEGFAGFCPATSRFALALMDAGVEVMYLAPEFVKARHPEGDPKWGPLYLRYNQHWAPRAAELAAQLVGERVKKYPWYESLRVPSFKPGTGSKALEGVDWIVREDEDDVSIPFGGNPPGATPERFLIHRVIHPELKPIQYKLPSSPITLCGGSFVDFHKVDDCDFTSQLYRFVGWPIDAVTPRGGIQDEVLWDFALKSEKVKLKKKLVIWMVPEQVFCTGRMWRKVRLFGEGAGVKPEESAPAEPERKRARDRKAGRERKDGGDRKDAGDTNGGGGDGGGAKGASAAKTAIGTDGANPAAGDREDSAADDGSRAPAAGPSVAAQVAAPASNGSEQAAGAPPPSEPAGPNAEGASSEAIRAARAARLAREKAALEREIAAIDAFGHVEEFRAALLELEKTSGDFIAGKERWAQVSRGWLPMMAVDHWLEWHQPAKGRTLPVAIDFELPNHPFPVIVDMAGQLHARDFEFLLVVFPSRVQLHPELVLPELERLPPERWAGFRGMVGATTRFLLALNEQGVETVNLAPAFVDARRVEVPEGANGEIYLAGNKHWTPRGAELAARVVAERIRAMPWFTEGPQKEGVDFELDRRSLPFTSTAGGQSPDRTPEELELTEVRDRQMPLSPKEVRRSPIVVLSDSFAKFYSEGGLNAGFVDQLRRFTGWPIDAIMPMGGAELQCRDTLARRGDDLRGKKVVVWLLQEDNLRPAQAYRPVQLFSK